MTYRTINLDAFSVVGVKEFTSVENGENFTKIPQMWANLPEETMNRLGELSNLEPSGVLGVCAGMHDSGFDYWIAVATTKDCPAGLEKLDIPAAQWLVFEVTGAMPDAIQDGFKRIFNECLPSSGYQHANAPEIEWYSAGDMSSPDYRSEIWIPVVKQDYKQAIEKKSIETSRLILRPITAADADDIFAYSKNGNVGINAGWKPHANIEETKEIMEIIFLNKENVYGIESKETGKLLGTIGLIADPKRQNSKARMLGYAIGEEYWNKGYTTEAAQALIYYGFEVLNLDLVSACCYPSNKGSKRVLEKCGFQYEGLLHLAEERYDGAVLDNECYVVINEKKQK